MKSYIIFFYRIDSKVSKKPEFLMISDCDEVRFEKVQEGKLIIVEDCRYIVDSVNNTHPKTGNVKVALLRDYQG